MVAIDDTTERVLSLIEAARGFERLPIPHEDRRVWSEIQRKCRTWLRENGRSGAESIYPDHGRSPERAP